MAIPSEFWESLNEATTEEKIARLTDLVKDIRENQEVSGVSDEQLEKWEAGLKRLREAHNKKTLAELNQRAAQYEEAEANRVLDEFLLRQKNTLAIPAFGKPKKDSH